MTMFAPCSIGFNKAGEATVLSTMKGTLAFLEASDIDLRSITSNFGFPKDSAKNTLPRFGITTTFVNQDNPNEFTKAVKSNTRVFFAESLGNPKLDVIDLKSISDASKKAKVPFIVDNTVASPALLNPIEHGANIVIHSLTKYLTGNGTSIGGVIIDAGTFDWANGNFPEFTEPNPSYHGLNYHEALGNIAFIAKVRIEGLRDLGI